MGPGEVLGGALGRPWGVAEGSLGVPGGLRDLLGILKFQLEKCHKGLRSDHPIMIVKSTKY